MIELETDAAKELLTLDDVKLFCRVDGDDEDSWFTSAILSARQFVENRTSRALGREAWSYTIETRCDAFDFPVDLPRPPFVSLTSVDLVDSYGESVSLDPAQFRVLGRDPARVRPAPGVYLMGESLTFRYQAGYTVVPDPLLQAMRMLIAHWYENREATTRANQDLREPPLSLTDIVDTYRVVML